MTAIISISYKQGILDPSAKATHHALEALGFENVQSLTFSKEIAIDLNTTDKETALNQADKMAKTLLVNEVIQDYKIQIKD